MIRFDVTNSNICTRSGGITADLLVSGDCCHRGIEEMLKRASDKEKGILESYEYTV